VFVIYQRKNSMGKSEIKMEQIPLSDRKERAKKTGFMQ
jgi:hypothetical protein